MHAGCAVTPCCVLCCPWVLRRMMLVFCVKEAHWGMMAFVTYLPLGFQNSYPEALEIVSL